MMARCYGSVPEATSTDGIKNSDSDSMINGSLNNSLNLPSHAVDDLFGQFIRRRTAKDDNPAVISESTDERRAKPGVSRSKSPKLRIAKSARAGSRSPRSGSRSPKVVRSPKSPRSTKPLVLKAEQIQPFEVVNVDCEAERDSLVKPKNEVTDSIIKDNMEGFRRVKQWNITEDSPGGHAREKLIIVPCIEIFNAAADDDDESYSDSEDSSPLEEDDDILDDPLEARNDEKDDQFENFQFRHDRKKALPSDPVLEVPSSSSRQNLTQTAHDRFAPSYANSDMWATDDDATAEKKHRGPFPSCVCSLISVSERGGSRIVSEIDSFAFSAGEDLNLSEEEHDEIYDEFDDHQSGEHFSVDWTKPPATAKRSGGRRQAEDLEALSDLHQNFSVDIAEDDDIEDDTLMEIPGSVAKEDCQVESETDSRRKKQKDSTAVKSSGKFRHRHGNSSSNRPPMSGLSGSQKQRDRGVFQSAADFVPRTPIRNKSSNEPNFFASPLRLTPNSQALGASHRHRQQNNLNNGDSFRRLLNKPLHLHVEKVPSMIDQDECTLGASTITTNFSTTQRTRGDNTVSTRSLFRSEPIIVSESPQLPQRKRAGSDESLGEKVQLSKLELREVIQVPASSSEGFSSEGIVSPPSLDFGETPVVDNRKSLGNVTSMRSENTQLEETNAPQQPVLDDRMMPKLTGLNDSGKFHDVANFSSPDATKRRRMPKLSLFRRGKSWKGAVPLSDDEKSV